MDDNTRSPLTKSPTINIPPEPSTVNYEAQDKKDDSEYQTYIERKPQVQVNTIVAAFIGAHDGPTTLLIVYYAGHGKPGSYYGSLVLHGLFEYLAATKEMATTQVPGEDSFTSALIYALEALVEEKGMSTTVELLRKIKSHAPNFPSDQIPVLSDRRDDAQAGRIMLHPLHRNQEDGSRTAISSEETSNLDALKRHTVTLHSDFAKKPPSTDIEILGRHLNQIFERSTLGVNRVRWGGMKRSAAARAVGSFQAGLQRSRRASMKQWPIFATSRDSPQALELAATGSVGVNPPVVSAISFPNSSSSNEESDDGHILVRRVRNKKQKSDTDGEEASRTTHRLSVGSHCFTVGSPAETLVKLSAPSSVDKIGLAPGCLCRRQSTQAVLGFHSSDTRCKRRKDTFS
ncbi:hypothetical protein HO133_008345 [Letharia lupina]|uniref:Uncharacterized protein n=1 Tax=Letharia lupina TaxID=560253 RepID=A0A8H6CNQ3_9LECA|nr:uncharacterized protein HO133_008345 [Letharia lupina]KAF6226904.1 hypothetical protein HO133_008345 [Letharia lupina]